MKKTTLYILSLTFILSSCGGGGGGGGDSDIAPAIPIAIINIISDLSGEVDVGTEFTFSWTTSNASSCASSGDWSETIGTSGSFTLTLNEAKNYSFTINCKNSEGTSSTKNISITANYLIVGGSIFHDDSEDKTVYIDQNHNRILDSFEYSATSDSNGNYQIRSFNNIECLKDYQIAVDNSYLFSINKSQNKEQVNISPFTSLFKSITSSGLSSLKAELYNSQNPCNLSDSRQEARNSTLFNRAVMLQENITGYSYEEIQQNPSNSSKQAITSQRLDDLASFYSSLDQLGNDFETTLKSYLDVSLSGTGYSSQDYTIRTVADLDYSNLVIFLNESDYPAALTDSEYDDKPNSIDDVSIRADISVEIDPNSNVSTANLNGWDESINLHIYPIFVTNKNDLIIDDNNCHVNPSSYCYLYITNDFFDDEISEWFDSDTNYLLQKETSRGLERIETQEYVDVGQGICDVYKSYAITNTVDYSSSDEFYTVDRYLNKINDWSLDYDDNSCSTAFAYPDYKWMQSTKIYNDNSRVYLSWDNNNIDLLPNVNGFLEIDIDNLPPNQIESEFIEEFLNQPNISNYKNNDPNMTDDIADTLINEIVNYITDITNAGSYDSFGWVSYYIINKNGGSAELIVESNRYGWYVDCYFNNSEVELYRYGVNALYGFLTQCLTYTDSNGDFIFSRSSTHDRDYSQTTVSPYDGLVPLSSVNVQASMQPSGKNNPKSNMDVENLTDEEIQRNMKNKSQRPNSRRKLLK